MIKQINVAVFCILTFAFSLFAKENPPYHALILEQKVISKETDRYCGWPSIAKTADGKLIVVYSGDRDWHVCPWGKIQMVTSDDNGQTWSSPTSIANTPLDDRDAGLLITLKGTVLVNWFTSLEFANKKSRLYSSRYVQYAEHAASLSEEIRQQWLGNWIWRSEDGIRGTLIQVPFSTPHGPIQLADGRILLITSRGVAESVDDGLTWRVMQQFHRDDYGSLSEVYGVETAPGKILALSRALRMRQFGSDDGGATWTIPFETNIQGYPPHIIKLDNGWLVAVYGRRYGDPMGQFACISRDNGLTWEVENEITLSIADKHHTPDGPIGDKRADLGYPCSVQLDDGSILTIYYQTDQNGEWPSIMGTRWKLEVDQQETSPFKQRLTFVSDSDNQINNRMFDGRFLTLSDIHTFVDAFEEGRQGKVSNAETIGYDAQWLAPDITSMVALFPVDGLQPGNHWNSIETLRIPNLRGLDLPPVRNITWDI